LETELNVPAERDRAAPASARKLLGVGYPMPLMDQAIAQLPPAPATNIKMPALLAIFAAFGLLWFELINQLKPEWWLNPQYNYGLIVPVLVGFLLWKRWQSRPAPAAPTKTTLSILCIVVSAALFLPIRVLAEANPDWRFLSWLLAIVVITISLGFVYLSGGGSWLRHFAFPILFFLVAVPWPVRFEQLVIQDLMRAVTAINVIFLQLVGVPALQHGNVIEVGSGFIGIEEACSGVRSLQATFMISLFLGELYAFNVGRRFILVILGAILAFLCNVARTAILVWVGTNRGLSGIEAWHDPAGLTILIVCLFGLWIISLIMLRRGPAAPISRVSENKSGPARFNWGPVALLAIWLIAAEGAVQFWYRSHRPAVTSRWAVQWPNSESDFKSVPITSEAEALLQYNEGGGASWEGADGHQWLMFFFRWFPGRSAARFIKVHRPDICLPASGRTMERDNGLRMVSVNGLNLPVRSYRFDDRGSPLHVFYCYWDARTSYETVSTAVAEDWSFRGRVRAALQGRREIGAQILEIIVWGYQDDKEASEALARELGRVVRAS
jgi:exosortase